MSASGTSLQEARELYNILSECKFLLHRVETKSAKTLKEVTLLLTASTAVLGLMRRMNLGPEVDQAITTIQRLIQLLVILRLQLTATYATMGPLGWVLAGLGALSVVFSIQDLMYAFGDL
jgi:hypothetical protein